MRVLVIVIIITIFWGSLLAEPGFRERLKQKIDQFDISSEWKVFLIAMIPVFELRGAIPIGILSYKLPVWKTFLFAVSGNMVPIFFILLFFDLITRICFRVPILKRILEAIFARTRRKSALIEKYEEIGLTLFVAIPLPVTGAWTGSLAAYLFGLSFWKSILFIFIGVLIAGTVVTFLTSLKWLGALIAGIALIGVIIKSVIDRRRGRI